jgi:hypothetical protein
LVSNIEKKVVGVLDFSLSFLKKIWKKSHNMFSLMLDPRFRTLCLMSSLIDHEQGIKSIVEEYDKSYFLFPMFLKSHYHLHHGCNPTQMYRGLCWM